MSNCINSSKVYCKFISLPFQLSLCLVLIVAKCIVNRQNAIDELSKVLVLIVAECNVNPLLN